MRLLTSEADIVEGLAHLAKADRRLKKIIAAAGALPLRRHGDGFPGLARIVVGQQLSIASAAAIWSRLEAAHKVLEPTAIIAAADTDLKAVGLSFAKIRTLRAVADACLQGLDLNALGQMPGDEARAALVAIKGIGPWTADIYLLFCLGHADVLPAGDLALQVAVGAGLGLAKRPDAKELAEIAGAWSPWRGVAAALFWAYYRVIKSRASLPV